MERDIERDNMGTEDEQVTEVQLDKFQLQSLLRSLQGQFVESTEYHEQGGGIVVMNFSNGEILVARASMLTWAYRVGGEVIN